MNSNEHSIESFDVKVEKLKKNLEIIIPSNGLEEKLKWSSQSNVPLRVKLGFDPTAPDLHLGHVVVLKKLKEFQNYGHKIIIIIGDFTAGIGDPTGRNKTRPPLTKEQIAINAETYLGQLSKIIDLSKAEVHFNSKWFNKLQMTDLVGILSKVTLSQILQRDDFNNRYKSNIPIYFHELIYPIIQGYDSLMVEADIEIGGTDQLFNCLVGRDIQNAFGKRPQIVICVPILRGTDGHQKMGKSLNNYIGIAEEPNNIYGKVMSIPDNLIEEYARLVCDFHEDLLQTRLKEISDGFVNPMNVKKELAYDIVKQFYGVELAESSAEYFYKQVQSRNDNLIEFESISLKELGLDFHGLTLISLCSVLQKNKSKSELRRLIQGGGVTINSDKVIDFNLLIESLTKNDFKLSLGKRLYYQIIVKNH